MRGDFTRFTFDPKKHYVRVLKQQGRPDLDADWNEQTTIANHLLREALDDTLGKTAFPKDNSFLVSPSGDATDIVIQPGHAYVGGILAELDGDTPVSYRNQPDFVPLPPLAPVANRTDLVYLDVWERHITALEDSEVLEPALGGVDTTTRVRVVAQVRIHPNIGNASCAAALGMVPAHPGGGLLTTSTVVASTTPSSCLLPPTGGYRGLENRLYRVEIHQGGDLNSASFKWSRDNGGVVLPIASFLAPSMIQLTRLGRDQRLTIHQNDWVEVLGDQTELQGLSGTLVRVVEVDPHTRTISLSAPVDAHATETHPKVRRWDMPAGAIPLGGGAQIPLEEGIQVQFSVPNASRPLLAGDYWVFTARTGSAGLETILNAPARGVTHHRAALARITWSQTAGVFTPAVHDCRNLFPPLTAISASDVAFDNSVCDLIGGATTVQEAINALCGRECCALTAEPRPGWQSVFDEVTTEGGIICFRPGEYPLNSPVTVQNKGPLVLVGAGESTRIVVSSAECAIRFVNCGSIVIRDLSARAQTTGRGAGSNEGIRGVFDFSNCGNVTAENLVLGCASGAERAAACLSIHGSETRNWEARVRDCRLQVGVNQNGLVVLNPARVFLSGNTIEGTVTRVQDLPALLTNPSSLSELRVPLISKLFVNQTPSVTTNLAFPAENPFIRFLTTNLLIQPWMRLLAISGINAGERVPRIVDRIYRIADQCLQRNDVAEFQPVVNAIRAWTLGGAQAIVIGGTRADHVQIDHNVITDFVQGIHIGLSRSGPRTAGNARLAGNVRVSANSVSLRANPSLSRERHGIFVGNAGSIVVDDNTLSLSLANPTVLTSNRIVDGVRLFGYFGRHIVVRDNLIQSFGVGVRITARGTEYTPTTRFWRVTSNAILSPQQQAVVAPLAVVS